MLLYWKSPFSSIHEFDVILSFSSGAIMGLKDSTTGKVEPQDAAPQIDIPVLSLDELIEKTDDFGSTALIGEGSYGRVYYAILDNGTKMAVKKLDSTENEPTTEFLTQVGLVIAY
jgi:pto-interacting protein 1